MKRRITRLREGNHIANGRSQPRAIVETVYEDQMPGPGFQVVDANYLRDGGCRRRGAVPSLVTVEDVLDLSIGGLDGVGADAAHDQPTAAVVGGGSAAGIHGRFCSWLTRDLARNRY